MLEERETLFDNNLLFSDLEGTFIPNDINLNPKKINWSEHIISNNVDSAGAEIVDDFAHYASDYATTNVLEVPSNSQICSSHMNQANVELFVIVLYSSLSWFYL